MNSYYFIFYTSTLKGYIGEDFVEFRLQLPCHPDQYLN